MSRILFNMLPVLENTFCHKFFNIRDSNSNIEMFFTEHLYVGESLSVWDDDIKMTSFQLFLNQFLLLGRTVFSNNDSMFNLSYKTFIFSFKCPIVLPSVTNVALDEINGSTAITTPFKSVLSLRNNS